MKRKLRIVLLVIAGAYGALCIAARVTYPRILFPAPRIETPAPIEGARLVDLPHSDGTHTSVAHFPAPPGGKTFVIFHGNGETLYDEVWHAEHLKKRGHGALLVEYRGYGTTHGSPPTEASLYEDGEAAFAYLAREGIEDTVVWGWSLGSGVAAEMAARGHGKRLVLISPFTSITDMAKRVAPILPVTLLMSHRLDTLAKASQIAIPTLVIHGDADELIPFTMGERVAKALPRAELLRVAGGHHADLLYPSSTGDPGFEALYDRISEGRSSP